MEEPPKDKGKERVKDYDGDESMEQPEFDEDPYNIRVKMEHIFTDIVQYAKDFKPDIYSPPVCVKIQGFIGYNGEWTITLDCLILVFKTIRTLFVHSSYGLDKVSNIVPVSPTQPLAKFYNEKFYEFNIVILSPYQSEWPVDTIQIDFVKQYSVKLFDDSTTSKAIDYNHSNAEKPGKSRERARMLLERFNKQHESDDIEDSMLQQAIKASKEEMEKREKDAEIENIQKFYQSQLEKRHLQAADEESIDWLFDDVENDDLDLI